MQTEGIKLSKIEGASPQATTNTTPSSSLSNSTIDGERYDPASDEIVSKGSLKAWRIALQHDKQGTLGAKEWDAAKIADEKEAMRQLHELENQYPNASFLKTMMGQVEQHFGKKEEAAHYYEEAIAKNRHNPLLMFKLAESKRASGKFEQAAKYYRDVIKIQPDFWDARLKLAECLSTDPKTKTEALDILQDLVERSPENKEAKALLTKLKQ